MIGDNTLESISTVQQTGTKEEKEVQSIRSNQNEEQGFSKCKGKYKNTLSITIFINSLLLL